MADQKNNPSKKPWSQSGSKNSSDATGAVDKRPKVGDVEIDPSKKVSATDVDRASDDGMVGKPITNTPPSSSGTPDRKSSRR